MFSCISYPLKCVVFFPTCCFRTNKFTVRDTQLHQKSFILSYLPSEILGLLMGEGPWALTLWHQPALSWKSVALSCTGEKAVLTALFRMVGWKLSWKKLCCPYLVTLPDAHCISKDEYPAVHLDGFWLKLKTALWGSYVLSKSVACRHGDLGQRLCKKEFIPEKSRLTTAVATLPEEPAGPWSIKTCWQQISKSSISVWRQHIAPEGHKMQQDDIFFSHHHHHCTSAQPCVTAWRELQGGIQFKLHIYWLSSQPLVSIICFRYQIY